MASRGGAFVALMVVLCSLPVLAPGKNDCAVKEPLVPAIFVFGDSLVDVGNNNDLTNGVNNSCKANYPPYGIDYPPSHSPTGRFSNGYNLADQLAQFLGFAESPPPFSSLSKSNAARRGRLVTRLKRTGGINFASGGSGLLPSTGGRGVCGGQVVSMADQVASFTRLAGLSEAADLISKSLVFISVGSNDLFEYSYKVLLVDPNNSNRNDTAFLQGLVNFYKNYVRDLYAAGATKFSVVSPSLVGCCPFERMIAMVTNDTDGSTTCLATANNLSRQLYPMIESMLKDLSRDELPGMNYSLGDSIGMAQSIFNHSNNLFTTIDRGCCGSGNFGEAGCNSTAPRCQDRKSYFFWDKFHPTQAVSALTAQMLFSDNGSNVHPVNVQQLVASPSPSPSPA